MRVLGGIVTYNPDLSRLVENIKSIIGQVDCLLLIDNGSSNYKGICEEAEKYSCRIIVYKTNFGIAMALKQLMEYAVTNGFDWVLSLDQDSIAMPDLISEYKKHATEQSVGAMTCSIKDRNFDLIKVCKLNGEKMEYVKTCITSGFFISVQAYQTTSGYDDKMFIDLVDFDICYSICEAGFRILKIPYVGLLHEIGIGENVKFLGRDIVIFHHNSIRRYYMTRNLIYLSKKHPRELSVAKALAKVLYRIIAVFIYEDDKKGKLMVSIKGIKDGINMTV